MVSQLSKPTSLAQTSWRDELRLAYTRPVDLLSSIGLEDRLDEAWVQSPFPMRVPRPLAKRIRFGWPDDPILRQVLPLQLERQYHEGYVSDPVGDRAAKRSRGVLHKYDGRVLLITTGACAIHCRYCFRQHFPYATEHAMGHHLNDAINYVEQTKSIEEVILSGGDPLMHSTQQLEALTARLTTLSHVKRLRIHTRMPVVLPSRVTAAFLHWLETLPLQTLIVIHANHAQEFDEEVDHALSRIQATGTTLLNQSVLLSGINDHIDTLCDLMKRSFRAGALPYYLHTLDPVAGAAHFDSSSDVVGELIEGMRKRLSGYLVPRVVQEIEGAPYKVPIL